MDYKESTELWDALERKYAVSEDGRMLYICEQQYDRDVAAGIIAKLPTS
jgi:hypothetical protein